MKKFYFLAILLAVVSLSIPVRAYVTTKSRSPAGAIIEHKWKTFPLTWRMNPTQGSNVTGSRTQAEVFNQSFQAWQSVTTASVSLTQGPDTDANVQFGYDGINLITTDAASGVKMPPGVIAYTFSYFFDEGGPGMIDPLGRSVDFPGQILEADMVFNAGIQFTTNPAAVSDRMDLQSVATHEAGHFLGLDHASTLSSTMFWVVGMGVIYPRVLSSDDMAGISALYPAPMFATQGKISGTVRTTANVPVYGAIVVAVNASGTPVASAITDPNGVYLIEGLDAGAYTVVAEPLTGPINAARIGSLGSVYPDQTVNTNFTARYR